MFQQLPDLTLPYLSDTTLQTRKEMHTRHFLPDLRFHTPPCYTISGISFLPCETAPFDDPYFCSHNFVIDSI